MKRSPLLWLNLLNITPSAAKTIITIIWNGWVLHWCYKKTIEHEMATWIYKIISLLELKNISKAVLYIQNLKKGSLVLWTCEIKAVQDSIRNLYLPVTQEQKKCDKSYHWPGTVWGQPLFHLFAAHKWKNFSTLEEKNLQHPLNVNPLYQVATGKSV